MINEDYCSYEVAKLLKKKGFDVPLQYYYNSDGRIRYSSTYNWNKTKGNYPDYSCPTHQMAMKWLREEKNILLYVYPVINLPVKDDYTLFHWRWDGKKKIHAAPHFGDKHHNYESYEEAVEAAIKYSLENLI